MKLLLVSDTHNAFENLMRIMERENPDMVAFCGDLTEDMEELSYLYTDIPFLLVRGNCDYYDGKNRDEMLVMIEDKKIFITHGHLYNVKQELFSLEKRGREVFADIVLFGHTHRPYLKEGEMVLFNPGAVVNGEYGIIHLSKNKSDFIHKKI